MDPTPQNHVTRPASSAFGAVGAIALVLLIIGGINWALVGLLNVDLVATIFGPMSTPARIVYVVVGVAAVYALTLFPRIVRDTPRTVA